MNFLVDAQLPRRLARQLSALGHDAIHTLDLPKRNRTTDAEILRISSLDERVVITKDTDFAKTFATVGEPRKLLLITTGNIANDELERLVIANVDAVVNGFNDYGFIELTRDAIIYHL